MKNMKVKSKLLTGFLIVALVAAIIGVVGAIGLRSLADSETEMYLLGDRAVDAQKLATNVQQQRAAYNRAALKQALIDLGMDMDYSAELTELEALHTAYEAEYKELYGEASEARKPMLATLNDVYTKQYRPELAKLIQAMENADPVAFVAGLEAVATPLANIETSINEYITAAVQGLSDTNDADEKTANTLIGIMIGLIAFGVVVSVVLVLYISSLIATPATKLVEAANSIALGDVDVTLDIKSRDEMGTLAQAFEKMVTAFQEQASVLAKMAEGDFTVSITNRSQKDTVNHAINDMARNINNLVSEIRGASGQVSSGSGQIAQGAQALASGSTEQAAAVQQLSASINEIFVQSEENTKSAQDALEDTKKASEFMAESMESMRRMTEAMQEINNASQAISQVIAVIDNIAFQTNILSLNASVEAARAGQHGRGFAVVAEEVRNLATKSADAAKETAELIQSSIDRVNQGNTIAAATSKSLDAVAELSHRNAEAMAHISEASQRQSTSIAEINAGIEQISTVVQTNSATSQQSAASAQEMSAQAQMLNKIVSRFKVNDGAPSLSAHSSYSEYIPANEPVGDLAYSLPSGGNKYL